MKEFVVPRAVEVNRKNSIPILSTAKTIVDPLPMPTACPSYQKNLEQN